MIPFLSEKYDLRKNPLVFKRHLEIIECIQNFMKIRDYLIDARDDRGNPKYVDDEESKNMCYCRQFKDISSDVEFISRVYEKINRDSKLDFSDFKINSMFDEGSSSKAYIHFNLKGTIDYNQSDPDNPNPLVKDFTSEEIRTTLRNILKSRSHRDSEYQFLFFIVNPVVDVDIVQDPNYDALNARLSSEFGISVKVVLISKFNSTKSLYSKCFFDTSLNDNNIYLINKILTARKTLLDMVSDTGRNYYREQRTYIYTDGYSGKFGHFLMNLERRLALSKTPDLPLHSCNYFDIYDLYRNMDKTIPVYVHFVLESFNAEYVKKIEPRVREFLKHESPKPLHLVLVVNKKPTAKDTIEKIGDRPYKDHEDPEVGKSLTVDYHLLDNLQYNPLKNVNQPKFKLIKKGTEEHKTIIGYYGSTDDIPRMNNKDPVNMFFGGEQNDIYQIIRPVLTKINGDQNNLIHIDVAYRIVK